MAEMDYWSVAVAVVAVAVDCWAVAVKKNRVGPPRFGRSVAVAAVAVAVKKNRVGQPRFARNRGGIRQWSRLPERGRKWHEPCNHPRVTFLLYIHTFVDDHSLT
jgi:hypothetical protein